MTSHIGYMCMTDFEMDLPASDARVYASIEKLRKEQTCVDSCGIVEVEVKLVRVVQEPDESASHCGAHPRQINTEEDFAALFEETTPETDKRHKGD